MGNMFSKKVKNNLKFFCCMIYKGKVNFMKDFIANLSLLVFLFTPFVGIFFLVKKSKFNSMFKRDWSRKQIIKLFVGVFISSFITVGVFADSTEGKKIIDHESAEIIAEEVQNDLDEYQKEVETSYEDIEKNNTEEFIIEYVVDGDTVRLSTGEKIRYIGIDTPETKHPSKPVECYGQQAYEKNRELVEGKVVELEKDVSETDIYGRLLRYVYVDGVMINELLIKEGYAKSSSYPPDIKYQDRFKKAEEEARTAKKGLWSDICTIVVTPQPTPKPTIKLTPIPTVKATATVVPQVPVVNSGSCKYECSGPDRDCADFSSHAEAQAFFNCCGFTAQNDPMRLDGRGVDDGLACESI